ncbi:S9 family peptidase [Rubripirellula obstinata]|uniref:S9 family peptidase n=1 Tax=Rubripirellula obstinata TaxID=406547 RepID=UPI001EE444B2|nr:prolyl oligopeptidase family serine peptidase [Rubripirellula obstinata]
MPTTAVMLLTFLPSNFSFVSCANAYPPANPTPQTEQSGEPQVLTLERLYHPDKKFDFDGKLPMSHWIGKQTSKLLLKKDNTWKQFPLGKSVVKGDSASQPWQTWPAFDQLCKNVSSLANVDAKAATRSVARAVPMMQEESDTILVRIGDTLATVSSETPARILTRDAGSWENVKLDSQARRIGYTIDGDLYVTDVRTHLTRRLTDDGLDTLLDGELDWIYQEEIFGRGNFRAFWFSPDGNWLAMLRIDTSGVQPYVLSSSRADRGNGSTTRYSKSGDPIPHASLYVWDLRRFDSEPVPAPKLMVESTSDLEQIVTGVWWHAHDGSLVFSVSDRKQTYRMLSKADPAALENGLVLPRLLLREESPAWVEPPAAPAWLADGGLLWRSELPSGKYRVYRISGDGSSMVPVSPSSLNVRDFTLSPSEDKLWLVGDRDGGVDQHLYQCKLDQANSELISLTGESGWHSTDISPDGRWLVDRQSDPSTPPSMVLRPTRIPDGDSPETTETLISETRLMTQSPLRSPELLTITTDDSVQLPALLVKPDLESEDSQKFPVVVEVYGGPGTPIVSSRFAGRQALYRELLARRGIATLVVDNRSSSGTPVSAMWSIRGRMGEVEFRDVMSAVVWLKSQPWVDADRIAIRGWSFGGFLTLYSMTHSDAFVAGIAGGSVTDWHEYDSFYTERYMGLPSENKHGYETTSLISAAKNLSGRLLMIHGEVDDNVHPANTLRMAKALQKAHKPFQMMIYPGAAHSVSDPHQSWHMVQMTDQFLLDALDAN